MKISRPCYDKYHRCPGWAGPGWHFPKVDTCESGYVRWDSKWRCNRCNKCDIIVLPYHVRWLDPTWWTFWVPNKVRRWHL